MSNNVISGNQFHGTATKLKVGDRIQPGGEINKPTLHGAYKYKGVEKHTYATDDPADAVLWAHDRVSAERTDHWRRRVDHPKGFAGHIYAVEPIEDEEGNNDVEYDPNFDNVPREGFGPLRMRSKTGFRVVRDVTEETLKEHGTGWE